MASLNMTMNVDVTTRVDGDNTERRDVDGRVSFREDDDLQVITGHGAVFYKADDPATEFQLWPDTFERITPNAFDRALKESQDVRGLFNHDPSQLLGRTAAGTMTLAVDDVGLRYDITPADTTVSRNVIEWLKRGDVTGSSFAFIPREQTWVEQFDDNGNWERDIRVITDADIFDVGPVVYPAYKRADAGLRAAVLSRELRSSYDAWKGQRQLDRDRVDVSRALLGIHI